MTVISINGMPRATSDIGDKVQLLLLLSRVIHPYILPGAEHMMGTGWLITYRKMRGGEEGEEEKEESCEKLTAQGPFFFGPPGTSQHVIGARTSLFRTFRQFRYIEY